MSGNADDTSSESGPSIYEKFKQNTQKIFNEESFKEGLDKGYQMLEGKQGSHNLKSRESNKKSREKEYRNLSQAPRKLKSSLKETPDLDKSNRAGSIVMSKNENFNKSSKKKDKPKINNKKYSNSPIKLDKNLKNIENRILEKMKNKREGVHNVPLTKMPSLERNHSPTISYGNDLDLAKLTLGRVYDYNSKSTSKKHKYKNSEAEPDSFKMKESNSIRQNLSSAFNPSESESIMKKISYVKPQRDNQSNYDAYNSSYGSSIGFSDEKRLSDKMKFKIKASFRYRDEIETAETDSLFSSKFSKFSPSGSVDGQFITKPNRSIITEIMKRQQSENAQVSNFPSITKNIPSGGQQFSLPSLKK